MGVSKYPEDPEADIRELLVPDCREAAGFQGERGKDDFIGLESFGVLLYDRRGGCAGV